MEKSGTVVKSDDEWRKTLTPEEYRVTRQHGTERAFSHPYSQEKSAGTYRCVCCGAPLFSSETKYDSGTSWPGFYATADGGAVSEHRRRGNHRDTGSDLAEQARNSAPREAAYRARVSVGEGWNAAAEWRRIAVGRAFCGTTLRRDPNLHGGSSSDRWHGRAGAGVRYPH